MDTMQWMHGLWIMPHSPLQPIIVPGSSPLLFLVLHLCIIAVIIKGPWRRYNWRPLDAIKFEALGGLIIGGPWRPYNWKPLEAL